MDLRALVLGEAAVVYLDVVAVPVVQIDVLVEVGAVLLVVFCSYSAYCSSSQNSNESSYRFIYVSSIT